MCPSSRVGDCGAEQQGRWALRAGRLDYAFTPAASGNGFVASLLFDQSSGQRRLWKYLIVWPLIDAHLATRTRVGRTFWLFVSWGIANPTSGTTDFVPGLFCNGKVAQVDITTLTGAQLAALLPVIPDDSSRSTARSTYFAACPIQAWSRRRRCASSGTALPPMRPTNSSRSPRCSTKPTPTSRPRTREPVNCGEPERPRGAALRFGGSTSSERHGRDGPDLQAREERAALGDHLGRRLDALQTVELDQREQRQRHLEQIVPRPRCSEARLERVPRARRGRPAGAARGRARAPAAAPPSPRRSTRPRGRACRLTSSSAASAFPMTTRHSAIRASMARTSCFRADVQEVGPGLFETAQRLVEATRRSDTRPSSDRQAPRK